MKLFNYIISIILILLIMCSVFIGGISQDTGTITIILVLIFVALCDIAIELKKILKKQ